MAVGKQQARCPCCPGHLSCLSEEDGVDHESAQDAGPARCPSLIHLDIPELVMFPDYDHVAGAHLRPARDIIMLGAAPEDGGPDRQGSWSLV